MNWKTMHRLNGRSLAAMLREEFGQADASNENTTVEDLWAYMAAYEENTGGRVLAIPHNSNLSNGMMFEMTETDGSEMTREYAAMRARMEPVIEVTQIKGDSETHPFLSPNDEMAGFGGKGWELGNLPLTHRATPDMYAGSYARSALLRGLSLEQQLGVNPYAFGMIGSTDSHTALATGDEDNFFGKTEYCMYGSLLTDDGAISVTYSEGRVPQRSKQIF